MSFQTQVLNSTRVKVYKVRMYNAATDETIISRRMATSTGAAIMHGDILPATEVLIHSEQLERGEQWTERDFDPSAT